MTIQSEAVAGGEVGVGTARLRQGGTPGRRGLAADIVAGVGASAGGLEAMVLLFAQLRPTGRVAYVVAQHMANGAHSDLVVRLIQRESLLPVSVGIDGQALQADYVVVIPGGQHGTVQNGTLRLLPPSPERFSTPSVDLLMESIATQLGTRGVGIVLSGAGRDGAQGCRALVKAGGTVLVQDSSEAGFASMPEAVSAIGAAVLRRKASEIGRWIIQQYGAGEPGPAIERVPGFMPSRATMKSITASSLASAAKSVEEEARTQDFSRVIARVRETTRIDFSEYRPETLLRRLHARQRHLALDDVAYKTLLNRDAHEAEHLQKLFLVSLSWFWRDRACFDALAEALRLRLAGRPPGSVVRAWVPGCASGEEAFTLAALLADIASAMERSVEIDVVGTDLNLQALAQASSGQFPAKCFKEAPAGWAERWFTRKGEHFTARSELARMVRFQQADIEAGPPETLADGEVDIISCRNLLIYFLPTKQERLLARFAAALRPDGVLFIGLSENLGTEARTSFRALHAACRIYARKT